MTLPKQQTAQGASDDDVLPKFATFQGAAFEHNPSSFQIKCTGSTTPLDIPLSYKIVENEFKENILFRISIPTIPSHDRVYGYAEAGNGILFPLNRPTRSYNGTKDDSVGPGQYEIKRDFIRGSKTPIWKSNDSYYKKEIAPIVGPGDYRVENKWIKHSPNKKQSLGFLSTCKKAQNVKSNLPGPGEYDYPNSIRMQSIRMLKRHSLRKFQRSEASEKVLSIIPANKYIEELELKAKFNNKLMVMNTLKSEPEKPYVGTEKRMQSRSSIRRRQINISKEHSIKNFQVMLTGRHLLNNGHKSSSRPASQMKF